MSGSSLPENKTQLAAELLSVLNKTDEGQRPKTRRMCQLAFAMLCSVLHQQFDNSGLVLAGHGPVQSDPVWHRLVQHFRHTFKTTSDF